MILRRSAPRVRRAGAVLAAGVFASLSAACDKVPLLAPTLSIITLVANASVLPVNGTTEVTATVIESAGTAVQNGTLVTFTTTLGSIQPSEARTQNGRVTVRFNAGLQSGSAVITASSGGATPQKDAEPVTIRIGAAAAGRVAVTANPATLPSTGGTAEIVARVFDINGDALPGVQVSFAIAAKSTTLTTWSKVVATTDAGDVNSTGSGTLSNAVATTDQNGDARTTLTAFVETIVNATVGGALGDKGSSATGTVTVRVNTIPTLAITISPDVPVVGEPVTFTLTPVAGTTIRSATIAFGDGSSADLGSIGTATKVSHIYRSTGTFTVTVTGVDSLGEPLSTSTVVAVSSKTPTLTIVATPNPGVKGGLVTFTLTPAAGFTLQSARISFGDGSSANLGSIAAATIVTHVYNSAGTFTVTVTGTDTNGRSFSTSTVFTVVDAALRRSS